MYILMSLNGLATCVGTFLISLEIPMTQEVKVGGLIESEYQIFFNNKSGFTLYDYFSHTIQILSEVNR